VGNTKCLALTLLIQVIIHSCDCMGNDVVYYNGDGMGMKEIFISDAAFVHVQQLKRETYMEG